MTFHHLDESNLWTIEILYSDGSTISGQCTAMYLIQEKIFELSAGEHYGLPIEKIEIT